MGGDRPAGGSTGDPRAAAAQTSASPRASSSASATATAAPSSAFSEAWLRAHPVPDAAAFRELRALGEAQRDDILQLMQRRFGNAFVQEQLAASEGIADADAALPHQAEIQRAFGKHDVGSIRTQTGGAAEGAAKSLGARAFASEERIAFTAPPDLHTAAHEAAHVIQQRRGAAPAGVGAKDGTSEKEADRVADLVVAGASAEAVLDHGVHEASAGTPAAASIQRKPQDAQIGPTQEHWDFVKEHLPDVLREINNRIRVADPHPRLRWGSAGTREIYKRIKQRAELKPEHALYQLSLLAAPGDLWAVVDTARRGPMNTKLDAVASGIAAALDGSIHAAIARMGARAIVQWDLEEGKPPPYSELVPSSPMDSLLVELLVDPGLVKWQARASGAPPDVVGEPFKMGLLPITQFEWVGERDRNLWNWIEVKEPRTVTAEQVAATMFQGVKPLGADRAFEIGASPPFFALPPGYAHLVPRMHALASVEVDAQISGDSAIGKRPVWDVATTDDLRGSKVADQAALAQAPKAQGQLDAPRSLFRTRAQADDMVEQLTPYRAQALVEPTRQFLTRREAEAADPKKVAPWAATLETQERILHAAASELREITAELQTQKVTAEQARANPAIAKLLQAYARAGGASHLHAEAPALLADARRLRGELALAMAEAQVAAARGAMMDLDKAEAGQRADDGTVEPDADKREGRFRDLERQDHDLRGKIARGESVSTDEIDALSVDAQEAELRARLSTLSTNFHDLQREAKGAGVEGGRMYGQYSIDAACAVILQKINGGYGPSQVKNDKVPNGWREYLDLAVKVTGTPQYKRQTRAKAVKTVTGWLEQFQNVTDWNEWFKSAHQEIQNERLRSLIKNIALQIGIAVVTGEAIGVIGAAVRGITLAGEIGAEIRNASLAWEAASVVAQTTVNTTVQGAMGGPMDARAFIENGLAIVLTSAAMKPFQGMLEGSAAVEGQIVTWGKTAAKGGKLAAELVIETGAGIGAAGLAHAMTHGGEVGAQDAESWVTMGLSIAATKFVGRRTAAMKARVMGAAKELNSPKLENLGHEVEALEKAAAALGDRDPKKGKPPTEADALELLKRRNELLVKEHRIYEEDYPSAKHQNEEPSGTNAQLLDVPLQLAHLSPIVDGHMYEGTPKQVQDAFRAADESGIGMKREWIPERDAWHVTSNEPNVNGVKRTIEIHEIAAPHETPEQIAAAHAIAGTEFVGRAPKGEKRPALKGAQAISDGHAAASLLDPSGKELRVTPDGVTVVGPNGEQVKVRFSIGDRATTEVARHSYRRGATDAEIKFSKEARGEDLQRAAAHELAEIRAMLKEPRLPGKDALVEGSAGEKLSAHDQGRLAELDVLLRDSAATGKSNDVARELDALLHHLGFDPHTLETNRRALRVIGEDRIGKLVDVMVQREVPHAEQFRPGSEDQRARITDEFEQRVRDAEQAQTEGRLQIGSAEQLAAARANQPRAESPPDFVKASEHEAWGKYAEYWSQRAAELRQRFELERRARANNEEAKAALKGPRPEPMVTWETYKKVRNPFERGHTFEGKVEGSLGKETVGDVLGGKSGKSLDEQYVIKHQVGVASKERLAQFAANPGERETPQRPDHLALNKQQLEAYYAGKTDKMPEAVAFSDKSRMFETMRHDQVPDIVDADIAEALGAYSGPLEIRSDQFRNDNAASGHTNLRGKKIDVDTVVLVYDAAHVGQHQRAIENAVTRFKTKKTVRVIFQ